MPSSKKFIFYLYRTNQGEIDIKWKSYKFDGDLMGCKGFCEVVDSLAGKPETYANNNKAKLISKYKAAFEEYEAHQEAIREEAQNKAGKSASSEVGSNSVPTDDESNSEKATSAEEPEGTSAKPDIGINQSTATEAHDVQCENHNATTTTMQNDSVEKGSQSEEPSKNAVPDASNEQATTGRNTDTGNSSENSNDDQNEYKIGDSVLVGYVYKESSWGKPKKKYELERTSYTEIIRAQQECEHIWVYPDTKDTSIIRSYREELCDSCEKDERCFSYPNKDKAKTDLGISKRSTTGSVAASQQSGGNPKYSGNSYQSATSPSGKTQTGNGQSERVLAEIQNLKKQLERLDASLSEVKRQSQVSSRINQISQKLEDFSYYFNSLTLDVKATADTVQKKTRQIEDTVVDTVEPIKAQLSDAITSTETMQGKLAAVEEKLSAKGVRITRELNPTNADSKVIANAKTLAIRLIESLTDAATAYADNKDIIENAVENEVKRNAETEEKILAARESGKKEILMEILEKYENLDDMLEDPNNDILAAFMRNNGLEQDKKLTKGKTFTIKDDAEIQKYGAIAKGVTVIGKYSVERSLFKFNGKNYDAIVRLIENEPDNTAKTDTDTVPAANE